MCHARPNTWRQACFVLVLFLVHRLCDVSFLMVLSVCLCSPSLYLSLSHPLRPTRFHGFIHEQALRRMFCSEKSVVEAETNQEVLEDNASAKYWKLASPSVGPNNSVPHMLSSSIRRLLLALCCQTLQARQTPPQHSLRRYLTTAIWLHCQSRCRMLVSLSRCVLHGARCLRSQPLLAVGFCCRHLHHTAC